jgi:hypothetical protein
MEHTHLSSDAEDRAPLFMPESLTRRQRLRAIAAGGENLYEPPNTAEAFARLEAAIDEVKFHGSMSEGQGLVAKRQHLKAMVATYKDLYEPPDTAEAFARLEAAIDEVKRHGGGGDQMLEPPTTAKRFNRIESAIDEVLAGHTANTETPRRVKQSKSDPSLSTQGVSSDHHEATHLLKKRQLHFADQSEPAEPNVSIDRAVHETVVPSLRRRPRGYFARHAALRPLSGIFKPSNASRGAAGETDIIVHNAVDLPHSKAQGTELSHDVDVFRDDDSVKAFANETYQSARERHL